MFGSVHWCPSNPGRREQRAQSTGCMLEVRVTEANARSFIPPLMFVPVPSVLKAILPAPPNPHLSPLNPLSLQVPGRRGGGWQGLLDAPKVRHLKMATPLNQDVKPNPGKTGWGTSILQIFWGAEASGTHGSQVSAMCPQALLSSPFLVSFRTCSPPFGSTWLTGCLKVGNRSPVWDSSDMS